MRVKILDRYLAKSFLAPFAVCVAIFSILVVLGRYFEKLEIFNNFHAKSNDIASYLLLTLPYWLNVILPVATMLALLFSVGALQQRGELTACRSAGISTRRLFAPYFTIGLLLSLVSLAGGLSFLPELNFASRKIYRVNIKKTEALTYRKDHVVVAGRDHRRFTIGWLDAEANTMKDVIVDRFGDNLDWIETISARRAVWSNGIWTFYEGIQRRANEAQPGTLNEEPFDELIVDIPEKPKDFVFEDKPPDDMTGPELRRRIRRLKDLGAPSDRERVAYQLKLALPFANVVVIALGIPFAVRSGLRGQGRTQSFTYALVLAFLYWGMTSVFQSLGEQGRIPAWLAAWTANLVFLTFAAWRLRRVV